MQEKLEETKGVQKPQIKGVIRSRKSKIPISNVVQIKEVHISNRNQKP